MVLLQRHILDPKKLLIIFAKMIYHKYLVGYYTRAGNGASILHVQDIEDSSGTVVNYSKILCNIHKYLQLQNKNRNLR